MPPINLNPIGKPLRNAPYFATGSASEELTNKVDLKNLTRWEPIEKELASYFQMHPEAGSRFKLEVLRPNLFESRKGYLTTEAGDTIFADESAELAQVYARGMIELLDLTVPRRHHDNVILHCRLVTEFDGYAISVDKIDTF